MEKDCADNKMKAQVKLKILKVGIGNKTSKRSLHWGTNCT
jgi:hypothetical protein